MRTKLIILEGLVWFTVYLSISTLSLFFGKYLPSGNATIAGLAVGVFFFIRALTDILAPKFFTKLSKQKLIHQMCLSILLLVVGYAILCLQQTLVGSLFALVLLGISLGLYNPAKYALYASLERTLNESKWGILDSIGLFTVSISSGISGILVGYGGFYLVFWVAFSFSIATLFYSLSLVTANKSSN